DPHYGLALSLAALCRADLHVAGWSTDAKANQRIGVEMARQALESAGDDPWVLSRAAYALGCLDEDITTSLALAARSVELNPSFPTGWLHSGWLRLWAGQADIAIEHFVTSMRLNPRAPSASAWLGIGVGHFFERRFAEAEGPLLQSRQLLPGWVGPYRFLAS